MELRLERERVLRHADDASTSIIALRGEGRSFDVGAAGRDPGKAAWRHEALRYHQRLDVSGCFQGP
jgi:hypothetical protein